MLGRRGWIALWLFAAVPAGFAQATDTPAQVTTPRPHHRAHKAPKPLVLPPLPAGPLRQLPMDQLPPVPAQVSYQNGLLSIAAQNSTLGEILGDVRKLTGAWIDIPPGPGANERVVTSLGPGEPRDVLARLLNGSKFNYVMVGSVADPTAVASLTLTVKPLTAGEPQPVNEAAAYETSTEPMAQGPQPPVRFKRQPFRGFGRPGAAQPGAVQQANAQADDADSDDKDDDDDSSDDSDDSAQTPQVQPQVNINDDQDQTDQNQPNAGPKTPEQIMEMLRRQQQPGGLPVPPNQPPQ